MGIYNTEQRCIIEKYLIENEEKFVSSKDILEYLKKNNIEIGLTTIYRTLKLLEKDNKLRIEVREQTKYYQYIKSECSDHFHLDCEEFMSAAEHIKEEHHFMVDYNTIIYGICEKCLK